MNLPNPFPGANVSQPNPTIVTTTTTTTTTTVATPKYKFKTAGKAGVLIGVILDESGSMATCRDTTIAGFNEFVKGQRSAVDAGSAFLTLNKFDAPHIKTVFADRPLAEVPELNRATYSPNGGTNLLDAIGFTINQVNTALSKHTRANRPGVIIVIQTDGQENASSTFRDHNAIKEMVKAAEVANWSFIFMGANIDSFAVGSAFGMNVNNTVNYSTNNMGGTYASLSSTTTRMRASKMAGTSVADIYETVMFSDAEKKQMGGN